MLTDDEITKSLSGEHLRGPRTWRGRELAPLSRGLRDLRNKVVAPEDTASFHDVALLLILTEAHHPTTEGRLEKRRSLIAATDDVAGFRARVSLTMDELGEEDAAWQEVHRLVNEILGIVDAATVSIAPEAGAKKKEVPEEPSPMTTPSSSPSSPESSDGLQTSSAGS